MIHPKSTRGHKQSPQVWKFLCVKLNPDDERTLAQGIAAARALGLATVRTRSAFVRQAIYEAARRNVETAQRLHAESV